MIVANSLPQMANLLREGKVDLYIDSTFPSITGSCLSGSKLPVRRRKKGVPESYSLIFGRKDRGLDRPEDLRGKVICFEESFSTSGYMLPKAILMQQGLPPAPLKNPAERVSPGDVGDRFSNDDENTMLWVVKGKAAAGAKAARVLGGQPRQPPECKPPAGRCGHAFEATGGKVPGGLLQSATRVMR